jgi:uncharacterized membrane-anchored protein
MHEQGNFFYSVKSLLIRYPTNLTLMNLSKLLLCSFLLLFTITVSAQDDTLGLNIEEVETSLHYQTGTIELEAGNAKLHVPQGFRYLDSDQAPYVLEELWGNPPDSTVLGLLVPENRGVLESNSWVFNISFDEMGYVKDDDADDIDYDDLLKEQQKEMEEENPGRIKEGYSPIKFIGWASTPFYDKDKKVLHWAKEFKFGDDSLNTLNYNLRVLGRKGVFVLNAISSMEQLPEVKSNIGKVTGSVVFNNGSQYADFDPKLDEVAAWTIGGLVAGKILAKVGFFALILKFWKLIALGAAGAGAFIWKLITGKKNEG